MNYSPASLVFSLTTVLYFCLKIDFFPAFYLQVRSSLALFLHGNILTSACCGPFKFSLRTEGSERCLNILINHFYANLSLLQSPVLIYFFGFHWEALLISSMLWFHMHPSPCFQMFDLYQLYKIEYSFCFHSIQTLKFIIRELLHFQFFSLGPPLVVFKLAQSLCIS